MTARRGSLTLIGIALLMAGLLSYGYLWPYLLGLDGRLEVMLRSSWLACIFIPSALLCWLALRRAAYLAGACVWLAIGLAVMHDAAWFRSWELAGQAGLLWLWMQVALHADTRAERGIAWGAAMVHAVMATAGAVAKTLDHGWTPDQPEVLERVYGVLGAALWFAVPAGGIILISWLVARNGNGR